MSHPLTLHKSPRGRSPLWRQLSQDEARLSFGRGARGYIIANLQETLGITADGIFGPATEADIQDLQESRRFPVTGRAGVQEFRSVGLDWPTDFERCMNIVSCFEGTSFGDCNPTDIDGAGLTMGVAGFTSLHSEVQMLLAQYLSEIPGALDALVPPTEQARLLQLFAGPATADEWRSLFFNSNGRVKDYWQNAFREFGRDEHMQQLQLRIVYSRFWKPALAAAKRLGFSKLQARCFFLDVAVQNGGWRKQHEKAVQRDPAWHSADEPPRLAAAARAVAACAKKQWQQDVLSRKLAIAKGEGRVHGTSYNIAAFGLA